MLELIINLKRNVDGLRKPKPRSQKVTPKLGL